MDNISIGCRQSIKHLSKDKQLYVIELTRKYKQFWEETIEYVEKTEERNVRRYLRTLKRNIKLAK